MKETKGLRYKRGDGGALYESAKKALEWQLSNLFCFAQEMNPVLSLCALLSKRHQVFKFARGIEWPLVERGRVDYRRISTGEPLSDISKVAESILYACDTPNDVMNALKQIGNAIVWCRKRLWLLGKNISDFAATKYGEER